MVKKIKNQGIGVPQKDSDPAGDPDSGDCKAKEFPIIGLGASAGGLEALTAFFSQVPDNSGLAYFVVMHLSPKQPSMLPELLQRVTSIPVAMAKDGEAVRPDCVHIAPPDKEVSVFKGVIQLLDVVHRILPHPIDFFFKSLATDQGPNAAAVIFSGTGTDGTLGAREIKSCEGLVLVQSLDSAKFGGMPGSALSAGVADMDLEPGAMPEKLVQYFRHQSLTQSREKSFPLKEEMDWLNKVFAILRVRAGHDFSPYKKNTILRRISRRMGLNQIETHEQYIRYLRENPEEADALFRELLIGVTNFFRDPESFEALKDRVLPETFAGLKEDAPFRVWVPGCSTGEEVYSLAMVLRESLDSIPRQVNLQLFGTDINKHAIDKAREGLYPASISEEVGSERLKRFFTKEEGYFRIRKEIRDSVVFSVQDVLRDPPFSRLNLLCCRNLLIYLDSAAQKKLLPLFHYTLGPGGIFMLGTSETIGGFTNLFQPLEGKWKIYRKREVPKALARQVDFPSGPHTGIPVPAFGLPHDLPPKADLGLITRQLVLEEFSPPSVLIDPDGGILQVQGRTGRYLEQASGPPSHNIVDMAREGLRIELSSAIRAARTTGQKVMRRGVRVRTNGNILLVDLHVRPLQEPKELAERLLVVFQDAGSGPVATESGKKAKRGPAGKRDDRIVELERELQSTRESHQTTVEELEASNEELKSANEGLQSSNEELQSTSEEMESSKEELQSLNEELQTVNAELQSKLEELSAAQDDMRNLLNGTEIATIFVGNELQVKRFTREATRIINLIPADTGRPLQHVLSNLDYENLIPDLAEVLETLKPREAEVQTKEGQWYKMRIMPYRTMDNRIDGAVLTFMSIEGQKKAQEVLASANREINQASMLVRTVFDMNREPLAVLDGQEKLVIANEAFCRMMNVSMERIYGLDIFSLGGGALEQTDLKSRLAASRKQEAGEFEVMGLEMETPDGKKSFLIHCRILPVNPKHPYRVLLMFGKSRGKAAKNAGEEGTRKKI